jgi:peptidoglycan/LPS O-acetylase OafA/YrhL
MRFGPSARERLALALALAAGALAAGSLTAALAGGGRAPLQGTFAVVAAVAGAACLAAWRGGDRADRRRGALRSLGALLLAVGALAFAQVVGGEPWRTLLEGAGVAILLALVATARGSHGRPR